MPTTIEVDCPAGGVASVRLTDELALTLRRAVNIAARAFYAPPAGVEVDDAERSMILGLEEKFARALDVGELLCRHCRSQARRSSDGLCGPCGVFRRDDARRRGVGLDDGRLPGRDVLRRRVERAAQR